MIRKPAVAGSFYPRERSALEQELRDSYLGPLGPGKVPPSEATDRSLVAFIAPHAAYQYSGQVAAHSFLDASSMRHPELIVVVAPNHWGVGSDVATFAEGDWETPLGRIHVSSDAASELLKACSLVSVDPDAHREEHSLEVQLPFLQQIYGDSVPLLPISMLAQDIDAAFKVGKAVASLARNRKVILVGSSDLTHYEGYEEAVAKDRKLLDMVQAMDVEGFYATIDELSATACGYGPIASVMTASLSLGLTKGELLKYANSGDTSGDMTRVVGYGAVRFV